MTPNPARPAPGALLARIADVPDGAAKTFDFQNGDALFSVLIARRGDALFAYENRCAHAHYPLERPDGRVMIQDGKFILGPAHFASYALDTGACAGGPCNGMGLTRIPVTRDGEAVRMGV